MDILIHTLDNGIRLVHQTIPGLVAHCGLLINTGSRDESAVEHGMAHFIEHMLFKGTKKENPIMSSAASKMSEENSMHIQPRRRPQSMLLFSKRTMKGLLNLLATSPLILSSLKRRSKKKKMWYSMRSTPTSTTRLNLFLTTLKRSFSKTSPLEGIFSAVRNL